MTRKPTQDEELAGLAAGHLGLARELLERAARVCKDKGYAQDIDDLAEDVGAVLVLLEA